MRKRSTLLGVFGLTAVASLLLGLGCTGLPVLDRDYDYFTKPDPRDAWTTKIAGWQRREFAEENGVLSIGSRSSQGHQIEAVPSRAGVSGAAVRLPRQKIFKMNYACGATYGPTRNAYLYPYL